MFGDVERPVGAGEGGQFVVFRLAFGAADTGGEGDGLVAGRVVGRFVANGVEQALDDAGSAVGRGVDQHDGEFLAADAGQLVDAAQLTDCILWAVPQPQAQTLALRYPVLSWGLLQTVGQRLAQVENRMEEVAYKRLPERLAGLLLELANGGKAIRGTSHQALADMLGTYRETISAILRSFKDEGLVELGYRKIELRDLPGLRLAAGALD